MTRHSDLARLSCVSRPYGHGAHVRPGAAQGRTRQLANHPRRPVQGPIFAPPAWRAGSTRTLDIQKRRTPEIDMPAPGTCPAIAPISPALVIPAKKYADGRCRLAGTACPLSRVKGHGEARRISFRFSDEQRRVQSVASVSLQEGGQVRGKGRCGVASTVLAVYCLWVARPDRRRGHHRAGAR